MKTIKRKTTEAAAAATFFEDQIDYLSSLSFIKKKKTKYSIWQNKINKKTNDADTMLRWSRFAIKKQK